MSARKELTSMVQQQQGSTPQQQPSPPTSSPSAHPGPSTTQPSVPVAKGSAFKILTFSKLAEVFAKLVTANSLDNVFVEGEIEIYVNSDMNESLTDLLSYGANRPMDVLLWEAKKMEGVQEEMKFFKVITDKSLVPDSTVYLMNMKAIAFSYLLVMTRGSLPLSAGVSSSNKLPNLLTSRMGMPANSVEGDFANKLSRIDLSKVDCKWMLNIDISSIPDPIKNRIAKGTAGSRALKIILASIQHATFAETKLPKELLEPFAAMIDVASAGSAYLSMHPLRQQVQSQIPNFYRSCLMMAFKHVGAAKVDALKASLKQVQSFAKDAALNDIVVVGEEIKFGSGTYVNGFERKTYDQVKNLFGNSL